MVGKNRLTLPFVLILVFASFGIGYVIINDVSNTNHAGSFIPHHATHAYGKMPAYSSLSHFVPYLVDYFHIFDVPFEIALDKLPALGETATLTLTFTNNENFASNQYGHDYTSFRITHGFEFIGIDEDQITIDNEYDEYVYYIPTVVQPGQTITQNVTIRAVEYGPAYISVTTVPFVEGDLQVYVEESETLLLEDWYNKYGWPAPSQRSEVTECPPTQSLADGRCIDVTFCHEDPEACKDWRDLSDEEFAEGLVDFCTNDEYASGDRCTIQETKQYLVEVWEFTDEELDKYFPPDVSAQSFFFPKAYATQNYISIMGNATAPPIGEIVTFNATDSAGNIALHNMTVTIVKVN